MSVARGFGLNGRSFYTNVAKPMEVNLNFVVDSTNGNGLGVRSIKSNGYVESVKMTSCFCWVTFKNNFNRYLGGFSGQVSPLSGTNVPIGSTSLVVGHAYVIVYVGTSTAADWKAVGLPDGFTPTVGQAFVASKTGNGAGSGQVQAPLVSGSNSVEVVGDPNTTINNYNVAANAGARVLLQFLLNGAAAAPADGSVVGMTFKFDGSTVSIDGI